ncbi:hypothetical protein ACOJBO_15395 [Rhizobium beringeri]
MPEDHWSEHDESADRADHQHLANGKARDQPLAHCIVQRKEQIAEQHQHDASHDQVSGIGDTRLGLHLSHPRKNGRACAADCGFCLNTADVNGQFEAIASELGREMCL